MESLQSVVGVGLILGVTVGPALLYFVWIRRNMRRRRDVELMIEELTPEEREKLSESDLMLAARTIKQQREALLAYLLATRGRIDNKSSGGKSVL